MSDKYPSKGAGKANAAASPHVEREANPESGPLSSSLSSQNTVDMGVIRTSKSE